MMQGVTDRVYYSAGHTSRQEKKPKLPNLKPREELDTSSSFRHDIRPFAASVSCRSHSCRFATERVIVASPTMINRRYIQSQNRRSFLGKGNRRGAHPTPGITETHNVLNTQYGSLGGGEKGGRVPLPPFEVPSNKVYCILGSEVVVDG